eukprot:TRINITY_DN107060_c0_g1_i2.p1 TRINITY_DN107060_c0_g1~~TRINITY_DN107060_c0_g1_i2.p1  ORF type:complete len:221 (-),score=51.56 TRINITY_DN107060_c0_g1_i2:138-800(-)
MVYLHLEGADGEQHHLMGISQWKTCKLNRLGSSPRAEMEVDDADVPAASSPPQCSEAIDEQEAPIPGAELSNMVMRQVFNMADKDHDGLLSKAEFTSMMRKALPELPCKKMQEAFARADSDHDRTISFEEFAKWMRSDAQKDVSSAITQATATHGNAMVALFRLWDHDDSGTISLDELRELVTKVAPEMADVNMSQLFEAMDRNKDGQIDYLEFANFLFG